MRGGGIIVIDERDCATADYCGGGGGGGKYIGLGGDAWRMIV